jgi:hypothetical protein
MHKALTMPPGTEVVPLYRADDALIRELVAVLWSIQIDEDESRTTTKLLAGQALAKAKAAGF